jgi:integrase
MGNQRTSGLQKRGGVWHIDKRFRGARICESTGTSDIQQAKEFLAKRVMELREVRLFGARRERTFRAAATKFLEENQHKRSLERDARALAILDPYIGELPLRRVHHDTLQPYVRSRLESGKSPGTINRDLAVVRRILNLSARLWRDEADRPWLDAAPLIQMQRHPNKREPYPLSVEEQRLLFSELDGHLTAMALFKVNTGLREQEVVNLRWSWEVPVPELDTSVFVIPRSYVKNGLDRYVVLNRIAKSVISERRGEHSEFVFTCGGQPMTKIYNSGWKAARRRAAVRYSSELGSACPEGFRSVRVHDLKHTYGHRLRVAGVGFEDRKLLLGHKSDHVTTHYSAPEIGSLIRASEKVCAPRARKSHALTIVRARPLQQVLDFSGGERGTRTLDLGIMSATL